MGNKKIADRLSGLLADTYALYLKTQNYHWNVKGEMFKPLHDLFEEQYDEMAAAIDEIAERITTLGFEAPGSFEEFNKLTTVKSANSTDAMDMVEDLAEDHEAMSERFSGLVSQAESAGDDVTADLVIQRLSFHEKTAWMLRSTLG